MKRLIPYYRVSTARQGESGLGLEGQVQAVETYARNVGGTLLPALREVESGKRSDRPELAKAIVEARRSRATLVVAKLDRLTRDTRFFLSLRDSRVDFAFCDLPQLPEGPMGQFFLTMMVAVAELERRLISQRTKTALAAYKARGGVGKRVREIYPAGVPEAVQRARGGLLGADLPEAHEFSEAEGRKGREISRSVRVRQGREFAQDWAPLIAPLRGRGFSLKQIAAELNAAGHVTRQGAAWTAVQVRRVLLRSQAEDSAEVLRPILPIPN